MDSSKNQSTDVEEYVKEISPKKDKRRSSIFKRRSQILFCDDETEGDEQNGTKKIRLHSDNQKKVSCNDFNIKFYIDNLNKEKEEWKNTLMARKHGSKRLEKKVANERQQTLEIGMLSDAQKIFLAQCPNYSKFNSNLSSLHIMATKVAFFKSSADSLGWTLNKKIHEKVSEVTSRIIDLTD